MKEYELVYLNQKNSTQKMEHSQDIVKDCIANKWNLQQVLDDVFEKNLAMAQDTINEYVSNGWNLQQIICPKDDIMVGVFYRE